MLLWHFVKQGEFAIFYAIKVVGHAIGRLFGKSCCYEAHLGDGIGVVGRTGAKGIARGHGTDTVVGKGQLGSIQQIINIKQQAGIVYRICCLEKQNEIVVAFKRLNAGVCFNVVKKVLHGEIKQIF